MYEGVPAPLLIILFIIVFVGTTLWLRRMQRKDQERR